MKRKICVFPNDSLKISYDKGEIKERYFNPKNLFEEVHLVSTFDEETEESNVQSVAGKAKLKIYPVGVFNFFRLVFGFPSYRRGVLETVKKIQPDVIRAHNPLIHGYLAVYCGRKLGIPSIIYLHGDYDEVRRMFRKVYGISRFIKYYFWTKFRSFERESLRLADSIVCVTNFIVPYAKKYGGKDIEVIYNRVNTEKFRRVNRRKSKKITIVSVGRLTLQKNQECLIRAIRDLDVNLILIGDGEDYDYLMGITKDLGIEKKVKIIRSVPYADIPKYYSSSDIFAIASYFEGFCIPILEAMASSLPVVVPNKEPLKEVAGDVGIVVKNNPESFKKAFEKLIKNNKLRKELGERGRKRALNLDGKIMEDKEKELHERLLSKV